MSPFALEITKQEIEDGYRNLHRTITGGQVNPAVILALKFIKIDKDELWKFLKSYASTDINYRDTEPLVIVNALYNNCQHDQENDAFVAHAVAVLASATKTRNDSVLKFMPNKY